MTIEQRKEAVAVSFGCFVGALLGWVPATLNPETYWTMPATCFGILVFRLGQLLIAEGRE